MTTPPRVMFDLNVILDVLQRREPHVTDSARAMAAAETGRVEGLVAVHSLTTLFYLMTKARSAAAARVMLSDLLRIVTVAGVGPAEVAQALALPYDDFEDALQMAAAASAGAAYLISRDRDGFRHGPLPVLHPAEVPFLMESTGGAVEP